MSGTQIFELITGMLSGLALFIFGMNVMSDTLTLMAGGSLSGAIDKLTGKRIAGWAFGTLLAVFVQSSVTTVMTVGLVNSEIITVAQSVGVMIGANLGTTAGLIPIEITYSATIDKEAAGAPAKNEIPGSSVEIDTYAFQVAKTDGKDPLKGAQFELWSDKGVEGGTAAALKFIDIGLLRFSYEQSRLVSLQTFIH